MCIHFLRQRLCVLSHEFARVISVLFIDRRVSAQVLSNVVPCQVNFMGVSAGRLVSREYKLFTVFD
jgi:hypothetical protein